MNELEAHDILMKNGWALKSGVGYYHNDLFSFDEVDDEHDEAIEYMFNEFDCCFFFAEVARLTP
jgi:hypothetical protein